MKGDFPHPAKLAEAKACGAIFGIVFFDQGQRFGFDVFFGGTVALEAGRGGQEDWDVDDLLLIIGFDDLVGSWAVVDLVFFDLLDELVFVGGCAVEGVAVSVGDPLDGGVVFFAEVLGGGHGNGGAGFDGFGERATGKLHLKAFHQLSTDVSCQPVGAVDDGLVFVKVVIGWGGIGIFGRARCGLGLFDTSGGLRGAGFGLFGTPRRGRGICFFAAQEGRACAKDEQREQHVRPKKR